MESQKIEMLKTLTSQGWVQTNIEKPETNAYWWVTEIIELRRKQDQLFLSFLTDLGSTNRSKKEVDAVGFSFTMPDDHAMAKSYDMFYLNKGWAKEFKRVLEKLNEEK